MLEMSDDEDAPSVIVCAGISADVLATGASELVGVGLCNNGGGIVKDWSVASLKRGVHKIQWDIKVNCSL